MVNLYEKNKDDDYRLEKIRDNANKLFEEIKNLRKGGLNKEKNELSEGNIIFKSLRRLGYIEKLLKIISITYNKINSIP